MHARSTVSSARVCRTCASLVLPLDPSGTGAPAESWRGGFTVTPTTDFLARCLGAAPRLEALSRNAVTLPAGHGELAPTSLLAQTVHTCFDRHVGLSLAPEVLWYAILAQFATDVKQSPKIYRDLFTTSADQETLVVTHDGLRIGVPDGWDVAIAGFHPLLKARIPSALVDDALPVFSTSTAESSVAILVAFMDAATPFYRFEVHTRCGIPSIRLEGDASDWTALATATRKPDARRRVLAVHLRGEERDRRRHGDRVAHGVLGLGQRSEGRRGGQAGGRGFSRRSTAACPGSRRAPGSGAGAARTSSGRTSGGTS